MSRSRSVAAVSVVMIAVAVITIAGTAASATRHHLRLFVPGPIVPAPVVNVQPTRPDPTPHLAAPLTSTSLDAMAVSQATAWGDSTPANVREVGPITHTEALSIEEPGNTSGLPPDNTPVYLIVMSGKFKAIGAPIAPGAQVPTRHFLDMIVNANTGEGMDLGLPPSAPNLAAAGKVTML